MPENDVPRRAFLTTLSAATALSYSRVYGANERIQVGLIGAGEREGGAYQQPHLPGGHAAAVGQTLYTGQAGVHGCGQAWQDYTGAHVVARQQLSFAQSPGVARAAALQSRLGALFGSAQVARL